MHETNPTIDWSRLPVIQTVHQPQVYDVRFLQTTKQCPCPFPGCPGSSRTRNGLCSYFNRQHWGGRIGILEEHPNPLPKCKSCGIQVPVGGSVNATSCQRSVSRVKERFIRCKNLLRCFKASRVLFQINSETLPPLEALPYLGRTIIYNNSDWATVYLNLRKSWRRWRMTTRVL